MSILLLFTGLGCYGNYLVTVETAQYWEELAHDAAMKSLMGYAASIYACAIITISLEIAARALPG